MYNSIMKKRNSVMKNKKGFTLIEVIVVLVILAIMAAILVPSMVGWINKAKEKTAVVEGRSMLLAAQTVASEAYASDSTATALTNTQETEAEKLADVGATFTNDSVTVSNGKVTGFTMTSSDGKYEVTYNGSSFSTTDK